MFKDKSRKKAKERLEKARIRAQMGYDVSEDNIYVTMPEQKSAGEVLVGTLGTIFRTLCLIVVFVVFLIGAVSLIMPETRELLLGLWRDSIGNIKALLGV